MPKVDMERMRGTLGKIPQVAGYDSLELRDNAIIKAFKGILMSEEIPRSVPDEFKQLFSRRFKDLLVRKGMQNHAKAKRVQELLKIFMQQNIKDDGWVIKNNTAFSGINILRQALDNSENSVQAIENVNNALPEIKERDAVLYRLILEKALNPTEAALLTRLKILTERKDVMNVIGEFEKYGNRYANLATGLNDAKLGSEIQVLLNYVDNLSKSVIAEKLNYLRTTGVKVKSWGGNPADFSTYVELIQRIIDELGTKYGDVRLAKEIDNSNEVKHLIHYDEEVDYFKYLLNEVVVGEKQPDWGLFLKKFLPELKSEEEHIEQFGDSANAGAMEEVKKKYNEYPKMWISMLDGAIKMLNDPRKKREAIIAARERIRVIITAKIEDILEILRKNLRKPLKRIHTMVSSKLRDIGNAKKVYFSITQQRYRIFKRGLKTVRHEFARREEELALLLTDSRDESIAMRNELLNIGALLSKIWYGFKQQVKYDKRNRRAIRESSPIRAVPRLLMSQQVLVHLEKLSEEEKNVLEGGLGKIRKMPTRLDIIGEKDDKVISSLEQLFQFMISRQFVINLKGA